MTDPAHARDYPQYIQLDAEQDREDELQANGWCFARWTVLPPNPEMVEAFLRRANEDAAAVLASNGYYLTTARGRLAAEAVDAAARAQLDASKETT